MLHWRKPAVELETIMMRVSPAFSTCLKAQHRSTETTPFLPCYPLHPPETGYKFCLTTLAQQLRDGEQLGEKLGSRLGLCAQLPQLWRPVTFSLLVTSLKCSAEILLKAGSPACRGFPPKGRARHVLINVLVLLLLTCILLQESVSAMYAVGPRKPFPLCGHEEYRPVVSLCSRWLWYLGNAGFIESGRNFSLCTFLEGGKGLR